MVLKVHKAKGQITKRDKKELVELKHICHENLDNQLKK